MSKPLEARRFTIRRICLDDVPDLLQLAEECNLSPWSRVDYIDEIRRDDSTLLCLESTAGETIGFLVGRRVLSAGSVVEFDAELYNIGVKPRFQKQGCGGMMLNRFLEICRKDLVQNVWLDVRASNEKAIRFYKHFGFIEYTTRPGFYGDPSEDGIVMRLTL